MFTKTSLAVLAGATALTAIPAAAEARPRHYNYGYSQPYYGGSYYGGYRASPRYYGNYGNGYYGRNSNSYYGRNYYGRNRSRCGSGTTGAIIGALAGGLIGREIDRGSSRYYRRGNGTTGLIVGGAAGALLGREVGRSC